MTASSVHAGTGSSITISASDPEASPSLPSPKKPPHVAMAPPHHENQATVTPRPVVAPQRSRTASLSSGEHAGDMIGDYALGETIGKGTFGKVKLGLHLLTGEKVAIKILEKKRIVEAADVERVAREIKILKRNRHVNVIQLFEVIDSPERIFLIMEFVDGGEMFEFIVARHRIREPEAVVLFQQIVDGLDYLHANEVTHRDLKPENLLLQSCPGMPTGLLVKIVDFGLSNTHDNGRLLRTACGSPCYAAPEMIQGKLYKGPVADIWSLGVVLFAMVCGFLPFEDSNTNLLYKKILSADYKLPPFLSLAVQDLIRRIFETNPEKRISIDMIRQHPWFSSARTAVPRAVAMAASYDDARYRHHVLSQLAKVGLDPADVEDALVHKVHNHLTAAFYLLYNKLLRVMKDHPAPQPLAVSTVKVDGTPRRPEVAAAHEVRSTGIRTKDMVPVKAPSSAVAIASPAAVSTGPQQRRASDIVAKTSTAQQVARTPSQHSTAQSSPRSHIAPAPIPAAQPPPTAARRPSSVRSGRNLVLLTNGTQTPAATALPQRPHIPATRPPSQGATQGTRVSVSNGMVALTPLFTQKRPEVPTGGRRQTIIDAKTSASTVATMALTTASGGSHAHMQRRRTATHPSASDASQMPHAPLMARLSAMKEDDTRTTSMTEAHGRIPPQRPHPPSSSSPPISPDLTHVL